MKRAIDEAEARRQIEEEGIDLPAQPSFESPRVPVSLPDMDDDDLMKLFVRLTRWADYLSGQLALAEIDEQSIAAVLRVAEATSLIRNWGGGRDDRVAIAKAERDTDPAVTEWSDKLQVAHARRKLLGVMFTNMERDAALVSRELTRRVGREPTSRRADRWNP